MYLFIFLLDSLPLPTFSSLRSTYVYTFIHIIIHTTSPLVPCKYLKRSLATTPHRPIALISTVGVSAISRRCTHAVDCRLHSEAPVGWRLRVRPAARTRTRTCTCTASIVLHCVALCSNVFQCSRCRPKAPVGLATCTGTAGSRCRTHHVPAESSSPTFSIQSNLASSLSQLCLLRLVRRAVMVSR